MIAVRDDDQRHTACVAHRSDVAVGGGQRIDDDVAGVAAEEMGVEENVAVRLPDRPSEDAWDR